MTQDPIRLEGGLNPYCYVDSNPVGWVDPLGLLKGIDNTSNPLGLPYYPNAPLPINGKINIGSGKTPLEGYYYIDLNPQVAVVHKGDAVRLPEVKTGSQQKINIDNPYGYDPLNPEILRILARDGEIRMVGNLKQNKFFRNALKSLDDLNLRLVSQNEIRASGYKLSDGSLMNDKTKLTEVIIKRKK